ncbi:MAG: hypothetical protein L6Q92_02990 [Phycisphaerae bacterium]|nr:hypothetical protein [Phycisphaerae bacterium]
MRVRRIYDWLVRVAANVIIRRPAISEAELAARVDWPGAARRRRLRIAGSLRDLWRPRWLRLSRRDAAE